ncbi:30S ribosomal protein S27ae [Candidatus Woesearchaeota archaeon]|nr:30S ribosomal protein S27ae [Candidatus Woesearchaeota archaeon]
MTKKIHKLYDKGKAKNKSCPKCGDGVFLAEHKDRVTCGKCGYTEFKTKKKKEKKEESSEE